MRIIVPMKQSFRYFPTVGFAFSALDKIVDRRCLAFSSMPFNPMDGYRTLCFLVDDNGKTPQLSASVFQIFLFNT